MEKRENDGEVSNDSGLARGDICIGYPSMMRRSITGRGLRMISYSVPNEARRQPASLAFNRQASRHDIKILRCCSCAAVGELLFEASAMITVADNNLCCYFPAWVIVASRSVTGKDRTDLRLGYVTTRRCKTLIPN